MGKIKIVRIWRTQINGRRGEPTDIPLKSFDIIEESEIDKYRVQQLEKYKKIYGEKLEINLIYQHL